MITKNKPPVLFTTPQLRVELPDDGRITARRDFVHGWNCETIIYGCQIQTMKRHNRIITCSGVKIGSEERNQYGRLIEIAWDAPRLTLATESPGARATRSRVSGCHMLGLAHFLVIHRHLICTQDELDTIAAFDAAPAAPGDEYAEYWDCVVAPAEVQGQPQNINADKEGE